MSEPDAAMHAARERNRIDLLAFGVVTTGLPISGSPAAIQTFWLVLVAVVEVLSRRHVQGHTETETQQ